MHEGLGELDGRKNVTFGRRSVCRRNRDASTCSNKYLVSVDLELPANIF
ncbi:hypothetical protein ABIB87_008408 [Bradyrhizobium sp. JR18.2]